MSSRSEKDRYLPDTGASSIGGIPPACRNHRDPTGADTPHATAASSLVSPAAICTQNARSRSRRTGGRPGDRITARPVNAAAQPGGRPIESTSISEVLRPPVEPGQYVYDIGRTELVERRGWIDIRVVSEHSRGFMLHRTREALARRGYPPKLR
jgi:hypothetical protein